MTKILNKVGIEGSDHNIIKVIYEESTFNIIIIREKLKSSKINKKGKDALLASKVPSVDGQKHNLHTSKK